MSINTMRDLDKAPNWEPQDSAMSEFDCQGARCSINFQTDSYSAINVFQTVCANQRALQHRDINVQKSCTQTIAVMLWPLRVLCSTCLSAQEICSVSKMKRGACTGWHSALVLCMRVRSQPDR